MCVCVCVCVCVWIQECNQHAATALICTRGLHASCTYGHQCCNSMNSDDRVRCLATLRKRKQKDCSDSKSFNFGRCRVSVTSYCFHHRPQPFHTIYRHRIRCTNTRGIYMYFVYYNVPTSSTLTCACVRPSLRYSYTCTTTHTCNLLLHAHMYIEISYGNTQCSPITEI